MVSNSQFFRGAFWNIIGFIASTGIMFLMLPYIIRVLGIENYDIYGLLNAFVAPMGLIGLGIAPAIVRNIAIERTKNEHSNPEICKHVQTGTAVSLCIVGNGALIIILNSYIMKSEAKYYE